MKRLILIFFVVLALVYSTMGAIGDPTAFGNGTVATAWIGGRNGIVNATGNISTSMWFVGDLVGTASIATTCMSDASWVNHNNYPAACGAGEYVSAIGDTLTCATPSGTADSGWEVVGAAASTDRNVTLNQTYGMMQLGGVMRITWNSTGICIGNSSFCGG